MAHVRKQIRVAAAAAVTGLPTTGSRVFPNRIYNLEAVNLPALAVYTLEEGSERVAMGGRLQRTLQLRIDAYAKANEDLDDLIDQIAAEIEPVLAGNTLGGLIKRITLTNTRIGLFGEGQTLMGRGEFTFEVLYWTLESNPETAI